MKVTVVAPDGRESQVSQKAFRLIYKQRGFTLKSPVDSLTPGVAEQGTGAPEKGGASLAPEPAGSAGPRSKAKAKVASKVKGKGSSKAGGARKKAAEKATAETAEDAAGAQGAAEA